MSSTSEPPPAPLLEVRDLAVGWEGVPVLEAVDFTVAPGEILAVVGESGCGKSTLLRALVGLLPPLAGTVRHHGISYWEAGEEERTALRRRFGVAFQSGALWSSLDLFDNVAMPILRAAPDLDAGELSDLVHLRLALVGLADAARRFPHELSGGMRKRAAIARALALDPALVFLDEPAAGLDPLTGRRLDALLLELRAALGIAFLLVTHELASIWTVADRVLFLDAGSRRPLALGPPAELVRHGPPRVRAFLTREGSFTPPPRAEAVP